MTLNAHSNFVSINIYVCECVCIVFKKNTELFIIFVDDNLALFDYFQLLIGLYTFLSNKGPELFE